GRGAGGAGVGRLPAEKPGEVRRLDANRDGDGVWGVALSPDGRRAVSCGDDGLLRVFDLAAGRELRHFDLRPFQNGDVRLRGVTFAPDGRHALVASYDGTVRVWDVEAGKELRR